MKEFQSVEIKKKKKERKLATRGASNSEFFKILESKINGGVEMAKDVKAPEPVVEEPKPTSDR